MTDLMLFSCGVGVSAIFAAAIYTLARIKFNDLDVLDEVSAFSNETEKLKLVPIRSRSSLNSNTRQIHQ